MPEIINADPAPDKFREFRAKFDLSQKQAADFLGVSKTSWVLWENEGRPQVAARLLVTILLAKPELMELLLEK